MQFLSWHPLWWKTRGRKNEEERRDVRGRGTENREKFRGQLFERAGEKLNGSRTLEINTFSRHPLFSRVLEKLQVSRRLWKKKKKKEYTNGKKHIHLFLARRRIKFVQRREKFLSQFLWAIVFDVNVKGKKVIVFYEARNIITFIYFLEK